MVAVLQLCGLRKSEDGGGEKWLWPVGWMDG